jgi:hypothetical protein
MKARLDSPHATRKGRQTDLHASPRGERISALRSSDKFALLTRNRRRVSPDAAALVSIVVLQRLFRHELLRRQLKRLLCRGVAH